MESCEDFPIPIPTSSLFYSSLRTVHWIPIGLPLSIPRLKDIVEPQPRLTNPSSESPHNSSITTLLFIAARLLSLFDTRLDVHSRHSLR